MVSPFLLLRDIRSMTSVSKGLYDTWTPLNYRVPDLRPLICQQHHCPNRDYIYTTIDPFIRYDYVYGYQYIIWFSVNFMTGLYTAPLYVHPVCTILFGNAPLNEAIVSYGLFEEWIGACTSTASLFCSCPYRLERKVSRLTCCCHHHRTSKRMFPIKTTLCGDCLQSLLQTVSTKEDWPMLPMSFSAFLAGVWIFGCVACFVFLPYWALVIRRYL